MGGKGRLVIRINLDRIGMRLLVIGLLALTMTGSVASAAETPALGEPRTNAVLLQGASGRSYYLTSSTAYYDGSEALTACADGYHMASLWEIWDVSNLTYNASLGWSFVGGDGVPPRGMYGWVRTGGPSSVSSTPGEGNCAVWSGTSGYGTVAYLPNNWAAGTDTGPWMVDSYACINWASVWCVED
jgi:hypothetical protein